MIYTFFDNGLFHFKHIVIIVLCLVLIIVGTILALKYIHVETFHKILLIVGIISETLKLFTYIVLNESELGGYLPKTDLPFHLCSIQLIFILYLNLSKNEKVKHLLHSFMIPSCLIGGFAAILLATDSSRNNWVITFQYFVYHAAITAFALYLLVHKEYKFTIKDLINTVIMLFGIFIISIYINSILYYKLDDGTFANINFMYVINPPVEGLPFLNKDKGWLVYILRYALVAILACVLCYIKPIIDFFKNKKNKEVINNAQ